jgi:hypothetical protein
MVEGEQCPFFFGADPEKRLVRGAAQFLIINRRDIVPGGSQEVLTALADVFVQLELHLMRQAESEPE